MLTGQVAEVAVKFEDEKKYSEDQQVALSQRVWVDCKSVPFPPCCVCVELMKPLLALRSWYRDSNGWNLTLYPWTMYTLWNHTRFPNMSAWAYGKVRVPPVQTNRDANLKVFLSSKMHRKDEELLCCNARVSCCQCRCIDNTRIVLRLVLGVLGAFVVLPGQCHLYITYRVWRFTVSTSGRANLLCHLRSWSVPIFSSIIGFARVAWHIIIIVRFFLDRFVLSLPSLLTLNFLSGSSAFYIYNVSLILFHRKRNKTSRNREIDHLFAGVWRDVTADASAQC